MTEASRNPPAIPSTCAAPEKASNSFLNCVTTMTSSQERNSLVCWLESELKLDDLKKPHFPQPSILRNPNEAHCQSAHPLPFACGFPCLGVWIHGPFHFLAKQRKKKGPYHTQLPRTHLIYFCLDWKRMEESQ